MNKILKVLLQNYLNKLITLNKIILILINYDQLSNDLFEFI